MSDSFEELSARARRGELSRSEQQRLELFLKASLEARLWHDAGRQLDAEDTVLPGDHDAVERVMQRALSAFPSQRSRRRPRVALLMAVVALFGASADAASVQGVRYWRQHVKSSLHVSVNQPRQQPQQPRAAAKSEPAPAVAVAPIFEPNATSPMSVPTSSRAKPKVEPGSDAAALFGAASLSRREGNAAKAIALLDSLQERYPGSREARLSDMTLGALHLQRGAAAAALEHFTQYLRSSPQGELASEAVWGQYQALAALGQRAEAARRLRLLLERYPGSAYAAAARAKLKTESSSP